MSDVRYFHLYTGRLDENAYIVINGDKGFVVDPGGEEQAIIDIFKGAKARIEAILLTHAHFDHIGGVANLVRLASLDENGKEEASLAPTVFMHRLDLDKIGSYKNMGFSMGVKVEKFTPDVLLQGGETLDIAGLEVKVLHTPGHSKGGVCYIVKDKIFVGDTLFSCHTADTISTTAIFRNLKTPLSTNCSDSKATIRFCRGTANPRRSNSKEETIQYLRQKKLRARLTENDKSNHIKRRIS